MYATVLGFLFGAMPLVLVILYAFSDTQTHRLITIGLLPVILVLAAAVLAGAVFAGERFVAGGGDVGGIAVSIVTIVVVTAIVLIYVTRVSAAIRPTEQFADVSAAAATAAVDPVTTLLADITATEKEVCDLITRSDKFIQGDVGKAGQDNPALVVQAQQEARDAVGAPITDCSASWPVDVSGTAALDEAANRIQRMEATVKSFTGPELQKTYNRTVPCQEEFADGAPYDVSGLQARLDAVRSEIQTQQTKLLKPIDDKNAALQRGEVSDCDKRRGAKVAVTASSTGKTPNRG